MPRPRSLTHAHLAAAALTVIDRDGLTALTMRAVAKELGMSTMALYRYVDDRDELENLVVARVLNTVDTEPPPGTWRRQVHTMADRLRDAVRAHPAVIPLTVTHRHRSRDVLRWSEAVLGILATAGIDGRDRVIALRGILSYLIGAIQLDHGGPLAGPGTHAIAGLAADFPLMAETAGQAREVTADQEFHGGLAALLRGLG